MCVCVREREREKEREKKRDREREERERRERNMHYVLHNIQVIKCIVFRVLVSWQIEERLRNPETEEGKLLTEVTQGTSGECLLSSSFFTSTINRTTDQNQLTTKALTLNCQPFALCPSPLLVFLSHPSF